MEIKLDALVVVSQTQDISVRKLLDKDQSVATAVETQLKLGTSNVTMATNLDVQLIVFQT
jgi:uncharacterized membrane protein